MSPIAAGLDGLLALLLVAALVLGARLNGRLKALRDGQAGFAAAVLELNQAAARAEAGLNALRDAQGEAHEDLLGRIETARGLVARLDRASTDAERAGRFKDPRPDAPGPVAPAAKLAPTGSALAAIAALAEGRGRPATDAAEPTPLPDRLGAPPPRRRPPRGVFDDDLFEAKASAPEANPLDLGPLDVAPPSRAPRSPLAAWKTHR